MLIFKKLTDIFLRVTSLNNAKDVLVKTKCWELSGTKNIRGCND